MVGQGRASLNWVGGGGSVNSLAPLTSERGESPDYVSVEAKWNASIGHSFHLKCCIIDAHLYSPLCIAH